MAATSGALAAFAIHSSPASRVAAAVLTPRPVEFIFKGRRLRGTPDGLLLESFDSGANWRQVFNFGSQCAVLDLFERGGRLYAQIGVNQYRFTLQSSDARAWRTA